MIKNILSTMLVSAAFVGFVAPASAGTLWFGLNGVGDGDFNFEITETETFSFESGSSYNFNGGAGSNGNAWADGGASNVYGSFDEFAGGNGNAWSDTAGNNYANSTFSSASYAENGGEAADLAFGLSSLSFNGLTVAGGAGQANTGLTSTSIYTKGWGANFDYDVNANGGLNFGYVP